MCEGQRLGCFAFTARLCTRDWQVPGETFVIPKDTQVYIPIVSFTCILSLKKTIFFLRSDSTTTPNIILIRKGLTRTDLRTKVLLTVAPSKPLEVVQGISNSNSLWL